MKHIIMPDGLEIQVEPIMDKFQYLTSETKKYYTSYESYLKFCKAVIPNFDEIMEERKIVEQATGLKPKSMTQEEWSNFLENAKETVKIKYEKIRRDKKIE